MRSVLYQLKVEYDLMLEYAEKVAHDIRALKEGSKKDIEPSYQQLVHLQDRLHVLNGFIEHYLVLNLMKNSEEFDGSVAE